jgi:DNA-binding transcriptional LysR family regulator
LASSAFWVLPVIEGSDMIATVPRDLADVCPRYGRLRIVEPPIKSPVIAVHQFWHTRFHKDPAIVWLRGLVRSLFTSTRG